MSARKDLVEEYFEGFRRSDHERVLECLTEDVVWDLPGFRHLSGKQEFNQEIDNDEFVGSPSLIVDRLIEEAATVVAIGSGQATHKNGNVHRFVYSDVFTFRDNLICRVESYLVPLNE